MNPRPDIPIVLMAAIAVIVGAAAGVTAKSYGWPTDSAVLVANIGFFVCCYLSTLKFEAVLYQPKLEIILKRDVAREVDLSGLFDGGLPSLTVPAEKIWQHKKISYWVLLKAYATDTRAKLKSIINNVLFSILVLIVASAIISLAAHTQSMPSVAPTPSSGVATSLLTLLTTLTFAIVRVYIPVIELAQRNLDVLNDA